MLKLSSSYLKRRPTSPYDSLKLVLAIEAAPRVVLFVECYDLVHLPARALQACNANDVVAGVYTNSCLASGVCTKPDLVCSTW